MEVWEVVTAVAVVAVAVAVVVVSHLLHEKLHF
jgi:hypothetical protein